MKKGIKRFLANRMVKRHRSRDLPVEELEKKHRQPDIEGFNDSSYFAGWQKDGLSFVTRLAFRTGKHNENWLKIHIPGEGVWGFEDRPMEEGEGLRQGPLAYVCQEPGNRWSIEYKGPVFQGNNEEELLLELSWEKLGPVIDFDKNGTMYENTALQIAGQPWNKEFFRKLRELQKVHYEQAGRITGRILWKGQELPFDGQGIRDHSFGKRSWDGWERHIWFLGVLEDGRYFNNSVIDFDFIPNLKAGYFGDATTITTVASLPDLSEILPQEPLPTEVEYTLRLRPGEAEKRMKVRMKAFFPFTMDGVYHIRQALADFSLDGVPGMGIAEMGINLKTHDLPISY